MHHDLVSLLRRTRCVPAAAIALACVVAACDGGRCEIAGEAAPQAVAAPTPRSVPQSSAHFDDDYGDALHALQRRDLEPTAPTF